MVMACYDCIILLPRDNAELCGSVNIVMWCWQEKQAIPALGWEGGSFCTLSDIQFKDFSNYKSVPIFLCHIFGFRLRFSAWEKIFELSW